MIHSTLARRAWVLLVVPAALSTAAAQGRRGGGQGGAAPSTDLQWRNIGPNQAGRMVAVAGSAARPKEYYFGTTGGGVWKTVDGGTTLTPVTDAYFGGTIGALAVQESNPDVVWAGGGESPIRGNVSHGDGVWKSTDAGKTWSYMGLKETQQISRIRIDPTNPDVVYVGALGHVWGATPDRGVYKTTDGGKSWKKILFRDDSTGVADLIMEPGNPKVLYAAMWQAGRKPWLLISGGKGSGIFKTTDGGDHWTELTHNPGLPSGVIGRVGIAVSPVKPNKVWALIEHEPNGGAYMSNDGGNTWTFLSGDRELRQRAWYYSNIYADPKDTLTLVAPQVSPMWSHDGGKTWARGFGAGDNHDVYWAPDDPKRIAMAHDNGTIITTDGGTNSIRVASPTGQYYHVYLTSRFPVYDVCGAKQDAGSSCGPVRSAPAGGRGGGGAGGRGGAAAPAGPQYSEFWGAAGGESGYLAGAPYNPDITYGGNYSGVIDMQNRSTGERERLDPWPLNPMGHDAKDSKYRFQWTFPIMNSPFEPHTLYAGSNVVFKSTNDGKTWSIISPDLTKHDPKTLGASGGPITKDQTSIEYYATVFALQESPIVHGLIWAGSDDGLIHVTRDGGKTWKNVTPKGLPEWTRISIIDPSSHNPGTAYVAANRYQLDDFAPYLYKTTDYGTTWTKITNGIPADQFTRAIREDLVKPGMLYASTERGMFVSYDAGAHWESLQKNLPPVPVHDIALRDDDIVIATHGRAFWVMEGLTMLRQSKEAAAAASAGKDFLYKPAAAYRATGGVTVQYALAKGDEPVTIEFLDSNGKLIRKYSSTDSVPAQGGRGGGGGFGGFGGPARVTNRAGLNRYTWNLQYPDASTFRDMILWAGATSGPAAAPGQYKVRLTVGSAAPLTETFTVKKDPRIDDTNADLVEQHRFAMELRDRVSAANDGVKTIRNVKSQIEDRAPKMSSNPQFGPLAQKFAEQLSNVEDSLYQTKNKSGEDPLNFPVRINNQMAALLGFVENGERRPPKQSYDVFAVLNPQLTTTLTRLKTTMDANLPKLNAMLKAAGQPEIVPAAVEPPAPKTTVVP